MSGARLAVLIAVALAAPASAAAAPVDLGAGSDQRIAVDGSGAAHVAFSENVSGQDVTHYCKLVTGTGSCGSSTNFTYPPGPNFGSSSGVWPLLPDDGRVLVVDARCCQNYATKYLYTSSDGGQTFGPQTEVGDEPNSGAGITGGTLYAPAASVRPAESILTFTDLATLGLTFQATGTTGPPETTTASNVLTGGDGTNGSIGLSGQTLVATWWDLDDGFIYWRQWNGSGDVNDSANWSPMTQLEPASVDATPRLASGPSGIYLAYNRGTGSSSPTVVRKFTGSGWGPPVTVTEEGSSRFDVVLDPSGTVQVAWERSGALLYSHGDGPANSSYSTPQTLVADNSANGGYGNIRLGVGGGAHWVTWQDSSPTRVKALSFTPGLPAPERGSTVNVVPTKGKVFVKVPAGGAGARKAAAGFVPLENLGRQVPVGSTLDTSKGTVRLFSAANNSGGKTQRGDFSHGLFVVGQTRKNPLTTVSMTGAGLGKCSKLPPGGSPKLRLAPRRSAGARCSATSTAASARAAATAPPRCAAPRSA